MKRILVFVIGVFLAIGVLAGGADASTKKKSTARAVEVRIDISSQSMLVKVNGYTYGNWKVSTARAGYHTPRGSWRPFALKRMHYSRKYDNSPMPHSVFFLGGYAIHGTGYLKSLGRPASHGCIRLHPNNAAKLYSLIQKYGMRSTRITIVN